MKIAIATDSGAVSQHFGHCEGFTVYEIENNAVKEEKFIPNPGHQPGFLPVFLSGIAVKIIIAGGMGGSAIQIFGEKGIQTITGVSGKTDEVVKRYMDGHLVSAGTVCNEHRNIGNCGD